jgi:hypothetical protein
MSKTEIIAELARLSPEDLSEVRAWLDQRSGEKAAPKAGDTSSAAPHIRSPRLANRAQSAAFAKQITELSSNAAL